MNTRSTWVASPMTFNACGISASVSWVASSRLAFFAEASRRRCSCCWACSSWMRGDGGADLAPDGEHELRLGDRKVPAGVVPEIERAHDLLVGVERHRGQADDAQQFGHFRVEPAEIVGEDGFAFPENARVGGTCQGGAREWAGVVRGRPAGFCPGALRPRRGNNQSGRRSRRRNASRRVDRSIASSTRRGMRSASLAVTMISLSSAVSSARRFSSSPASLRSVTSRMMPW